MLIKLNNANTVNAVIVRVPSTNQQIKIEPNSSIELKCFTKEELKFLCNAYKVFGVIGELVEDKQLKSKSKKTSKKEKVVVTPKSNIESEKTTVDKQENKRKKIEL